MVYTGTTFTVHHERPIGRDTQSLLKTRTDMNYSSYRSEPSYYEERSPGGVSARTSMALATGVPQNLPSFDMYVYLLALGFLLLD